MLSPKSPRIGPGSEMKSVPSLWNVPSSTSTESVIPISQYLQLYAYTRIVFCRDVAAYRC